MIANYAKVGLICWCALGMLSNSVAQTSGTPIKNIVLVHGAWADGSGWKGIYDILVKDGYNVSIVQEPETSFQEDVAATKRTLALLDGPCILVAHSYGGAVITEAGTDPSVAGLVYVAAHMPDAGENEADDGKRFPSDLAKSGAIKKTQDGFTYIDPAQFHELFAADLPGDRATFMARSQVFNFADNFSATITTAAWRTKPSWMLVAGSDRTINPELERWYAKRAHSHTVEVAGASHSVYVSHPKEVADAIESAAHAVSSSSDSVRSSLAHKDQAGARMIATIESIDFTSWMFRLIGTKKHKHKSANRMGKWAVTFVVLAAALLTLPLYGQQKASGDSAGTDVPVNQVAGVTNPTRAALDSGAVAAPSSSQGGADPRQTAQQQTPQPANGQSPAGPQRPGFNW